MLTRSIKRISVSQLFGSYDYELIPEKEAANPERLIILYGDNGSGKTTILRILFHLLAPDTGQGHKTALAKIPFSRCEVDFTSGEHVWLQRPEGKLVGGYEMGLKVNRKKPEIVLCESNENGGIKSTPEIAAFLQKMGDLNLALYFLSDDRTVRLAGLDRREYQYEQMELFEEEMIVSADLPSQIIRRRMSKEPERRAQELLVQSLKRAERWIQSQAVRSASQGESSVNTLYAEILSRIAGLPLDIELPETGSINTLEKRIKKLEERSRKFSQYGLLPEFNGKEIIGVVKKAPQSHVAVVTTVITPYIESVEKKLEAMENIQRKIDSLVRLVNSFYTRKKLYYEIHDGFRVISDDGKPLQPQMLSSGERHLLLLFCNTIQALDRPSIFIIDEPEISLNVKWQRKLLSALLECAADNPVQYLFATHSFELLAKYPTNVIKLPEGDLGHGPEAKP